MNHYEITTIAGLLNDKLSKGPASSHYRHSRVVKPPRTRRRFAGKPRQD
jgi:hypothetical protein